MRASFRVAGVLALAGVFVVASRVIPHVPHRNRDHLGSGPPSASDIAWTGRALAFGMVCFLAAYLWFWWRSR